MAAASQLWYVQPKWNSLLRPIFSRHQNSICVWKTQREENNHIAIQFTKQVRSLHKPTQSNKNIICRFCTPIVIYECGFVI